MDSTRTTGLYTSLALDETGRPHISYADGYPGYPGHSLKHAWHDGAGWRVEVVDSTDDVGLYTSLALDGVGRPHISYYDDTNCSIKYARHDGKAWQIETVDSIGWRGGCTSLALDRVERPHISYRGSVNYSLKYAWHNGTSWQTETVPTDSQDWVGYCPSLALDASTDHPHISYFDLSRANLKYIWHDGTGWQIETVDCVGAVNRGLWVKNNALALDGVGQPHISYFDDVDGDLRYAWHDGTKWQTDTVDSSGYVGMDTSLVLDGAGRPHVSYYDSTNDVLKYARRDGTNWQIEIVDSVDYAGWHTSLALDGADQPHLSYYDYTNGDLKYAWLMPFPFLNKQAAPSDGLHYGDTLTYTLTLSGPGLSTRLWDPLPASAQYITDSVTPPGIYSPTSKAIVWEGMLPIESAQVIRYQVMPSVATPQSPSLALPIVNTARLTCTETGESVSATVIVNGRHSYLPFLPYNR